MAKYKFENHKLNVVISDDPEMGIFATGLVTLVSSLNQQGRVEEAVTAVEALKREVEFAEEMIAHSRTRTICGYTAAGHPCEHDPAH